MGDKPIKSVQRIFEILEMFDRERRPLAANEISKRLGYPLMSAHELCKSMHQLGYVDLEPSERAYIPSQTFISVLDWANNNVDRETDILACMSSLSNATRETMNLSRQFGTQVKIIHGIESKHAVGVSVAVGTIMPLTGSVTGLSLMACFEPKKMEDFLNKLSNNDRAYLERMDKGIIDDVLEELNERGTVMKTDVVVQGIGVICLPVRAQASNDIFVIAVAGPSERIIENQTEHRKSLKKFALQHNLDTVFKIHNPR